MSKEQLTPETSEKRALVFLSRLNKAERMHLLRASDAFPALGLREKMRAWVKESLEGKELTMHVTVNDLLNARIDMIRKEFPNEQLEFSRLGSNEYPELYVYVLNSNRTEEVDKFCREKVDTLKTDPHIFILTIVQGFEGIWPTGKPDPDFYERRKRGLARIAKRIEELKAQGIG